MVKHILLLLFVLDSISPPIAKRSRPAIVICIRRSALMIIMIMFISFTQTKIKRSNTKILKHRPLSWLLDYRCCCWCWCWYRESLLSCSSTCLTLQSLYCLALADVDLTKKEKSLRRVFISVETALLISHAANFLPSFFFFFFLYVIPVLFY